MEPSDTHARLAPRNKTPLLIATAVAIPLLSFGYGYYRSRVPDSHFLPAARSDTVPVYERADTLKPYKL